jgi:hypothetical protein
MPPMRLNRAPAALACLAIAATLVVGCGDDSESSGGSSSATVESQPAPPKSDFPSAKGLSLGEVLEAEDAKPSTLVVSPAAQAFYRGENRYPFGVFERDGSQIADAEVALYFAKVPAAGNGAAGEGGVSPDAAQAKRRAESRALNEPAIGPFPARIESLQTQPAFRAQTTTSDPDAATVVYSTQIDFPSEGEWRIAALIRDDGELSATLLPSADIGAFARVPRVGEEAPIIHTPTAEDAGGDVSQVTTRIPPDTQNEVDYADVVGGEPVVLLFATPQFCQSRVCGPVVDVAEQVKQLYGDEVAFIHMEIYEDNDPGEDVRPQVDAFHLPSEPWLFAIDRDGRIEAEIEGAFGVEELTRVVEGLNRE